MTYIRVKTLKKVFKKYHNDPEYTEEYEIKVFKNRQKFYDFCLSFFSPAKKVDYTVFTYPQKWYQKWLSPAPFPECNEIRQITILKADITLNSYYADKYDQSLQMMINTKESKL